MQRCGECTGTSPRTRDYDVVPFGEQVRRPLLQIEKEGKGCFYFADGTIANNCIEGGGTYTFPDGSYLKGTYSSGDLNGPCRQYDCRGRLTFDGCY